MNWQRWLFPFWDKTESDGKYTDLDQESILATIDKLEMRIAERFPDAGLRQVCKEFRKLAGPSAALARRLGPPIWPVRMVTILAAGLLLFVAIGAVTVLAERFSINTDDISELLQATEAGINELIFLGLALYFLIGLETRIKRHSALQALHRLRSIAHVVDMHQLTKDPAHLLSPFRDTESSPEHTLTRFELMRYLDYCAEMLALDSKLAALFAQNMDDPVVLTAVNELESLTQGLSGKIWQKIMILDLAVDQSHLSDG
ncbi:MAG: hypothetical protein H6574_15840 [Lewinellaceae bacterium]|nr:hypothetical protein [Saprospiraceae bacterium]MCB9332553.1 hypothetical protein [Lewinellaceae bacterium]